MFKLIKVQITCKAVFVAMLFCGFGCGVKTLPKSTLKDPKLGYPIKSSTDKNKIITKDLNKNESNNK